MRSLEEISTDIVNTRLRLEGIGMTNVAGRKVEELIALDIDRTHTEMRMASLQSERRKYMAIALAQEEGMRR